MDLDLMILFVLMAIAALLTPIVKVIRTPEEAFVVGVLILVCFLIGWGS